MPLQYLCRHWVNVHFDVWVGHVDPDDLRISAGHSFDGDAVVLLLVDDLYAKRDAVSRVAEIGAVVQQDRPVAYEVPGGAERPANKTGGLAKHLILC